MAPEACCAARSYLFAWQQAHGVFIWLSRMHKRRVRGGCYLQPQIAVCVALLRGIPSKRIYYFECFLAVFRLTVYYYYYSAN
jgi:hypothetical protein